MTLASKHWHIAPPPPPELYVDAPDLHPVLVRVLYQRGMKSAAAMRAFLAATTMDESPFHMKGVTEAVARIRRAIKDEEPIVVYGDFDADGVTATALMTQTLYSLGAKVRPYIPDREREGYGLNAGALKMVRNKGAKLVVTVDCGIRSVAEAGYAKDIGLDLIISDHHTIGTEMPPALAIINPQQGDCPYPFKPLSGVGVAFKVAQALLMVERRSPRRKSTRPPLHPDDLLDLVALGTVSDLVPLVGENRRLVRQGLERLNAPQRPGVAALIQRAGLRPGAVDANSIGYRLGPRLNAAGRLGSAAIAYRLLLSGGGPQADALAGQLDQLNRTRQALTDQIFERAKEQMGNEGVAAPILLAGGEDFDHGVVGLVAGKLCETYYRPAIVMKYEANTTRGSARSIPEFHITRALDECRPLLMRYGGHAAAAGFTVENAKRSALLERLRDIAAQHLSQETLAPALHIDAEVDFADLTMPLWEGLRQLEPCGYGNPTPLLCLRGAQIESAHTVGQDGTHLKLLLSDGAHRVEAIAFRQAAWLAHLPPRVDVVFALEVNEWNGRRDLQLNVQDLRPAKME